MPVNTTMETRQLGVSELAITPIGLGTWAIGGGNWESGWGSQDDDESIATIHRALDMGINWIDTAAVYGLGRSEEVVGRALQGVSQRPYIFTKCSLIWDEQRKVSSSLKRASVKREAEASLRRLQVERIDLYQIHWPNPDAEIEEGWTALAELQREGKVRALGVSNFSVSQMRRIQQIAPITSLQPPYSLLDRAIEEEILPFCQQQRIGVIAYSPMASGLLSGKMTRARVAALPSDDWRSHSAQFAEPQLSRSLYLVETLRDIGVRHGRTAGEVAIAWTLRRPEVTGAIVGARRPEQLDGVIGAGAFRLSAEEIDEIAAAQAK
ncbi:MAG TPA: aldo/keto reductase [Ktedonobacterales bacterium]|jgi:aryl-alcohol dehydrogenase-like predicted oxidoreductase|nr:aldo/keto reductase [Ktedonobacterales bacterium]